MIVYMKSVYFQRYIEYLYEQRFVYVSFNFDWDRR